MAHNSSLSDEYYRISQMMASLTMSWLIECMDRSVLCDIESGAQNGDVFLKECRRKIYRCLKTITDPENYDSIAQAFTMYAEANTYLLLQNKGVQLNRTPGTGGQQQKRPDFLFTHPNGEVYFEVKCLDFKGGKDRHRELSYKALDVAVDLDQRARKPGVHFGEEIVIAPFGEGSTPADRIETLISKLENNLKVEQFRYGPCILVVDLCITNPVAHHPGCILPIYYDENLKSCVSGELWHVALGYSGDMIYKIPEFDGQSNLDRCLKKDGIIHQYPELFGVSFVLHRLSGKKEIYSIHNMTPKKCKLKKQCTLSEYEIVKLIYSYSDAFNNSENGEQSNYAFIKFCDELEKRYEGT